MKERPLVFKIVTNRYLLAFLIFLTYLIFFDKYRLPKQYKLYKEYKKTERQKQHYKDEIQKDSLATIRMNDDLEAIEKYGREKYLMKKDNEDVFIIIEEEEE